MKDGIKEDRIVLAGFSQGGALSLFTGGLPYVLVRPLEGLDGRMRTATMVIDCRHRHRRCLEFFGGEEAVFNLYRFSATC